MNLQVEGFAQVDVRKLTADLKFRLHLLNEAKVFLEGTYHVLQGVDSLGVGVADPVDLASSAFAEALEDIVLENPGRNGRHYD